MNLFIPVPNLPFSHDLHLLLPGPPPFFFLRDHFFLSRILLCTTTSFQDPTPPAFPVYMVQGRNGNTTGILICVSLLNLFPNWKIWDVMFLCSPGVIKIYSQPIAAALLPENSEVRFWILTIPKNIYPVTFCLVTFVI